MTRIVAVLIVVACTVLAVTNPGEEAHKDVVYNKLSGKVGMKGFLGEVAGNVLGNLNVIPLRYNNYFLFSTMTFRGDVVSVGFLKQVRATDWEGAAEAVNVFDSKVDDFRKPHPGSTQREAVVRASDAAVPRLTGADRADMPAGNPAQPIVNSVITRVKHPAKTRPVV